MNDVVKTIACIVLGIAAFFVFLMMLAAWIMPTADVYVARRRCAIYRQAGPAFAAERDTWCGKSER